jgi:hypothetical protein
LHPLDRQRNVRHVSNSKHTTEKEFVDCMIPTNATTKEGIELGGRLMLFHVAFCTCNKLNRLTKSRVLFFCHFCSFPPPCPSWTKRPSRDPEKKRMRSQAGLDESVSLSLLSLIGSFHPGGSFCDTHHAEPTQVQTWQALAAVRRVTKSNLAMTFWQTRTN